MLPVSLPYENIGSSYVALWVEEFPDSLKMKIYKRGVYFVNSYVADSMMP